MRVFMVAVPLLLLLAGCTGPPSSDDQVPTSWWHRAGIQCESLPWEDWAADEGRDSEPTATEPFQRDLHIEELVYDYYVSIGFVNQGTRAYFDDLHRTQVCGNDDGWHYWMLIPDGETPPDEGWAKMDGQPEA